MDDKLTIDELIARLAAKQNMGQTDAEAFVCSFIVLIEDGLRRDKYVRVNGFGTFKLIDTDLNDGRIVFVPDASVRDAVNKPFSHFEPVELKDAVNFDDLEIEITPTSDEIRSVSDNVEIQEESVSGGQDGVSLSSEMSEHNDAEENDRPDVIECDFKPGDAKVSHQWYLLAAILLAGIVIGGGIMWGVLSHKSESVASLGVENGIIDREHVDVLSDDSLKKDSLAVLDEKIQDTVVVTQKTVDSIIKVATENKNEIKYLSDEVAYKISGTIEEYKITSGSTLSKVAYRYYRNRKLWPYIVMHNKSIIQDPNNVPIGTVLRIPVLTQVE